MLSLYVMVAKELSIVFLDQDLQDHMANSHARRWCSAEFETKAAGVIMAENGASELWIDLNKTNEYM